jgi:hypothetical protein
MLYQLYETQRSLIEPFSDLATWGRWEFGATYVALLKSGQPQVFSSRYAMVFFLLRSPQEETRKALQALRVAGVL